MNLGDWCPVLITHPDWEYWASRLERAMGHWEFSQSSKPMYLQMLSQHRLRIRPGLFEASAMILPIQITAHWKPSFWVMDVTVWKLVAGSEGTGNA